MYGAAPSSDGGAQVDVRRVEPVALDRERLEASEGGDAVLAQPRGLAGRLGDGVHQGAVDEA